MSNKQEATFGGGCGAQHGCERPENNPPHICTQGWGHFPTTPHRDFSGFAWNAPETPHTVMIP
jgi:hypothetical protein